MDNIPDIITYWTYGPASTFRVEFFNDSNVYLDLWTVREFSLKGYKNWNQELDYLAVKHFIEYYELYKIR